jgi:hypothetical protein
MLYSGVIRDKNPRTVAPPTKKFSCKNTTLEQQNLSKNMSNHYLQSVSSGQACTAFLNTAYYKGLVNKK